MRSFIFSLDFRKKKLVTIGTIDIFGVDSAYKVNHIMALFGSI